MAEGTPSSISSEHHRSDASPRGERSSGLREGGFRIRLSDNEMRSARALQEAFGLRSTVAVLGFALRTLGQQLEEGKLDALVEQHRAQSPSRSGGEGGRPEGRRDRPESRGGGGRSHEGRGSGSRGAARVDPFARPPRPTAAPLETEPVEEASAEVLEGVPAEGQEPRAVEAPPSPAEAPEAPTDGEVIPTESPTPAAETAEG